MGLLFICHNRENKNNNTHEYPHKWKEAFFMCSLSRCIFADWRFENTHEDPHRRIAFYLWLLSCCLFTTKSYEKTYEDPHMRLTIYICSLSSCIFTKWRSEKTYRRRTFYLWKSKCPYNMKWQHTWEPTQKKNILHVLIIQLHFRRVEVLKVNMKTHTGEKPFTCGYCLTAFSQQSHMKNIWGPTHEINLLRFESKHEDPHRRKAFHLWILSIWLNKRPKETCLHIWGLLFFIVVQCPYACTMYTQIMNNTAVHPDPFYWKLELEWIYCFSFLDASSYLYMMVCLSISLGFLRARL